MFISKTNFRNINFKVFDINFKFDDSFILIDESKFTNNFNLTNNSTNNSGDLYEGYLEIS